MSTKHDIETRRIMAAQDISSHGGFREISGRVEGVFPGPTERMPFQLYLRTDEGKQLLVDATAAIHAALYQHRYSKPPTRATRSASTLDDLQFYMRTPIRLTCNAIHTQPRRYTRLSLDTYHAKPTNIRIEPMPGACGACGRPIEQH